MFSHLMLLYMASQLRLVLFLWNGKTPMGHEWSHWLECLLNTVPAGSFKALGFMNCTVKCQKGVIIDPLGNHLSQIPTSRSKIWSRGLRNFVQDFADVAK